ncbi:hypothetical protein [Bacillus sp. NTK034]|uniref:hypothetical protein n=1 Tax=Bacillus sp. NTK034 TaxID=2802176 RepID=UPI001A8E599F|nr:hypothetical protein [Bacillus sp. NTK034]MBN8201974.1 hypothetical protein [Bacillus sp. NTK034]
MERSKKFLLSYFFKRDFNSSAIKFVENAPLIIRGAFFCSFLKRGGEKSVRILENNVVDMLVVGWLIMSRGIFIVLINIYVKSLFRLNAGKVMIEYRRNGSEIPAVYKRLTC